MFSTIYHALTFKGLGLTEQQKPKTRVENMRGKRGNVMLSVILALVREFLRRKTEGWKGRKAARSHSELISGLQTISFCRARPSYPKLLRSLLLKGTHTHAHTLHFTTLKPFLFNFFLLFARTLCTHSCERAQIAGRPSTNKHKSN